MKTQIAAETAFLLGGVNADDQQGGETGPGLDELLGAGSAKSAVTDGELISSMRYNAILGFACLFIFGVFNATFKIYRIRLSLRRVTEKPPSLPKWRISMIWMWIWRAVSVSDERLLLTAGLDALMLVKTFGLGIQLFFPLAIIGCVVLLPIHESTVYADDVALRDDFPPASRFVRLAASNVKPGSRQLWVHFICVYLFIIYALVLLDWHLKRYIRLRHRYLCAGDKSNQWRSNYFPESPLPERKLHHASIFHNFITKLFKEEVSDGDVRKGMLSRLATLRRDEVNGVLTQIDETPRLLDESRSCRSIPDVDQYQDLLGDNCSVGEDSLVHEEFPNHGNNEIEEENLTTAESSDSIDNNKHSTRQAESDRRRRPVKGISLPLVLEAGSAIRDRPRASESLLHIPEADDGESRICKWWLLRDGKTEIHSSKALDPKHDSFQLPRPSVRFLKTVNVEDVDQGREMAVNAQQYCVLLTNFPDVDRTKKKDEPEDSRTWFSKAIGWFFQEISFDRMFQASNWRDTVHRIGGGMGLTPKRASRDNPPGCLNETMLDEGTAPATKQSSWTRVKEAVKAGRSAAMMEETVVAESFRTLFPEDFVRALPIRDHKEIDLLVTKWDKLMGILERCEEYFQRTGKRQTIRRSKWWSFLCLYQFGYLKPADAIQHYSSMIHILENEIVSLRKKILSTPHSHSWLIIFRTQKTAAIASQALLHSERGDMCHVEPAPGPDEINWQALWKTQRQKDIRAVSVTPFIVFLTILPLGIFAGSLTSFNALVCEDDAADHYWTWYCEENSHQVIITGWIPPILVSIWQNMVMPNALYYLVQASARCISLSQLERNITHLFFVWDVLNIYLGGLLGGSVFLKLNAAVKDPADLMHLVGVALPASSNFFVNYICLRAFFLVPYQLLVPHAGVWYYLLRLGGTCGFARTPRDRARLWAPRSVRYGREYGLVLLIFMITLGYSVISPIIVPIALVYFIMSWLVWRYQILYIFVRKYESGGRTWPMVVRRILFSLWLFQFLTSCVLLTKEAYWQAAILWVTVPFILRRYYVYCDRRFEPGLNYVPLEMAHYAPPADIDPKVYTPPALLKNCAGWHPEYMKAWEGWGSPAYTL